MTGAPGRRRGRAVMAVGAAVGAAAGWAAERRALADLRDGGDQEAAELAEPVRGRDQLVTAPDGTRLHVETLGPDGAPTILLAHGYTNTQGTWHFQRRSLAGEFRVVSYDLRGHGSSEDAGGDGYTMEALAGDLAAVVEACVPKGQRAVVAGHSLGAMSALALAEERAELLRSRVAGVVLVSTSGSDIIAGILGAGLSALQSVAVALAPRVVGLRGRLGTTPSDLTYLGIRAIALCPSASPAHVAFTEAMSLGCRETVRAALIPVFTALDLTEAAGQVAVPALVMTGDRDRLTPLDAARRLVDHLPDARLVELPGVGHMAPLEAHETVTAHLRAFARRVLAEGA